MAKIIIGITGLMASGKDVSKRYLEKEYGASSHRFSTMLRDILNRLYLPVDRINLQNLSLDLRTRFGSDAMARVIAEDVKNDPAEIVVVDGIRRLADIVTLKDLPNFYLVSVDAAPALRHERLVKRNENVGDADKTFDQFLADHEREAELEIPTVMATAKYRLNNDGALTELYAQIDKIIADIRAIS